MKVLITGATGFIGRHLSRRLLNEAVEVFSLLDESENQEKLVEGVQHFVFSSFDDEFINWFREMNFDGVVHLSSFIVQDHKATDIEKLIQRNIDFSTKVIDTVAYAGVKWFINTGTFLQNFQNKEYSPANLYASTVQAFECIAQYYMEATSMNVTTLKLNDVFGPDDDRSTLFNEWIGIANSQELFDASDGRQIMDITYIENVIDAYMRLIDLYSSGQHNLVKGKTFAVKSNERLSLKDVAKVFEKATNTALNINWGALEHHEREVMLPWDRGRTVPGWIQRFSLADGIKQTFM